MIEDADYRCCRDHDDNNVSHVSGRTQHKFDGVYVVFGAQHHGMWERALCHYDSQRPYKLLILEWYEAGVLPFLNYTGFLSVLEQRWAYI